MSYLRLHQSGNPTVMVQWGMGEPIVAFLFGLVHDDGQDRIVPKLQTVKPDYIHEAVDAFFAEAGYSKPDFQGY